MNRGMLKTGSPGYEPYEPYETGKEEPLTELKGAVAEAGEVLKVAGTESLASMRQIVQDKYDRTKQQLARASDKAKSAAGVTDRYVRDNPWRAVGLVALSAFIIGFILNRPDRGE